MKITFTCALILFLSFSAFAQIATPIWNVVDSNVENRFAYNSKILAVDGNTVIIDSSQRIASYGAGHNYRVYKYIFYNGIDTFNVKYLTYSKGEDIDLKMTGVPTIKEVIITGQYLAVAPIYISFFASDKTPKSLKEQRQIGGWFMANANSRILYRFAKEQSPIPVGIWEFRIYDSTK